MTVYNFFILIWYSWQYLISLEKTILGCYRELHEANVDLELGLGDDLEGDLDRNLEPLGEITTDGDLDRLEETESKKNTNSKCCRHNANFPFTILWTNRVPSIGADVNNGHQHSNLISSSNKGWKQKVFKKNPVFGTWLHPIPWAIIEVTSITSTNGLVVPYDRGLFRPCQIILYGI